MLVSASPAEAEARPAQRRGAGDRPIQQRRSHAGQAALDRGRPRDPPYAPRQAAVLPRAGGRSLDRPAPTRRDGQLQAVRRGRGRPARRARPAQTRTSRMEDAEGEALDRGSPGEEQPPLQRSLARTEAEARSLPPGRQAEARAEEARGEAGALPLRP